MKYLTKAGLNAARLKRIAKRKARRLRKEKSK